uniref:Uncharacterized protein n=1 Tax=Lactuca sativa TaxID=4236 RepID=A0A9R1VKE2_LACSA|nr:hypothetical protein LSAT_V11C500268670 [Lactuca sativa]
MQISSVLVDTTVGVNNWCDVDGNYHIYCRVVEIMDDIHDFDTIDVELDAYFKKKQASRCKDERLNILCEEDDYEVVDDVETENDA